MFRDIAKKYPIYLINIHDAENEEMVKDIYEAFFLNEYGTFPADRAPLQVPQWYSFKGSFLIKNFQVESSVNPDDAYLAFYVPNRLNGIIEELRESLGQHDVLLSEIEEATNEG